MGCLLGHKWNGCKCSKCGKLRDEAHDWNGCICKICGKTRAEGHKYEATATACVEKCSICGAEKHTHVVTDGKCEVCGKNLIPWSVFTAQEREILQEVARLATKTTSLKRYSDNNAIAAELSAESDFVLTNSLQDMVFGSLMDAQMAYSLGSPQRGLLDSLRKKVERIAYPNG